jgi:hypothetical protein
MIDFIRQYQAAILFLAIVLALFGGYKFFLEEPETPVVQVARTPGAGPDQDLVALLFELKGIRLDNALFGDPLFKSLQNFGQELVSEPVGRSNPFAPLSGTQVKPKPKAAP